MPEKEVVEWSITKLLPWIISGLVAVVSAVAGVKFSARNSAKRIDDHESRIRGIEGDVRELQTNERGLFKRLDRIEQRQDEELELLHSIKGRLNK